MVKRHKVDSLFHDPFHFPWPISLDPLPHCTTGLSILLLIIYLARAVLLPFTSLASLTQTEFWLYSIHSNKKGNSFAFLPCIPLPLLSSVHFLFVVELSQDLSLHLCWPFHRLAWQEQTILVPWGDCLWRSNSTSIQQMFILKIQNVWLKIATLTFFFLCQLSGFGLVWFWLVLFFAGSLTPCHLI